jgi:hypothetical protein
LPLTLKDIIDDVRGGLGSHRAEMECAAANDAFVRCENRAYLEAYAKRPGELPRDWQERPKQYSYLTRRAIRVLSSRLYSPGPTRQYSDPAAEAFFTEVSQNTDLNATWQRLDRMATTNGVGAVQAVATGRPDRPIMLYLWGASEFVPYFMDDDPMVPWAIVTKSIVGGTSPGKKRRKCVVWTADQYLTFYSKDMEIIPPSGMMVDQISKDESGPNPYGRIPFSYAFNDLPVDRFGADGIGTALRECNQEVDRMLSDLAELLEAYNRPEGFIRGVPATWRYEPRAGEFQRLPASRTEDGLDTQPEPFYLQPQVDVASSWEHIEAYVNGVFQDLDVPLVAARGTAAVQQESGIAIAMKYESLTEYVEARRPAFAMYERDFARMACAVAGAYYGANPGPMPEAARLAAIADELEVDVLWPSPRISTSDQATLGLLEWQVTMGLESRTGVAARLNGITRTKAYELLERVAEERKAEAVLMADVDAERKAEAEAKMAAQQQPQGEPATDDDAEEDDDEQGPT